MISADVNPQWVATYGQEGRRMREAWLAMLGPDPIMPREIMMPIPGVGRKAAKFNEVATNTQEYFRIILDHAPRSDVWVGWSPSNQYDAPTMDWIFGDVDVEGNAEEALRLARRYEEECMAQFNAQPACIFTAGKGFHLHLRCDPIPNAGGITSEAFQALLQDAKVKLDWAPLKHRYAKPRLPYAMNLKATGKSRHPMHAVPVDLSWGLKEILAASADLRITPFRVPKSDVLRGLVLPAIEKGLERRAKLSATPIVAEQRLDLVQAALAFCEASGNRLADAKGRPDGRRRVLGALYIPALLNIHGGAVEPVLEAVQALVEAGGGQWRDYHRFTLEQVKHAVGRDGKLRLPMSLKRWWSENADLRISPERPF